MWFSAMRTVTSDGFGSVNWAIGELARWAKWRLPHDRDGGIADAISVGEKLQLLMQSRRTRVARNRRRADCARQGDGQIEGKTELHLRD